MSQKIVDANLPSVFAENPRPISSECDARVIAFIGLGRLTWLVGLDLGHLLCNAALGFQRVIGILEPQEIAFGQAKKLA
jgi:hypothetical protein